MEGSRKILQEQQRAVPLQFVTEDGKHRSSPSSISAVRSHLRKRAIKRQKQLNSLAKPTENARILLQKTSPAKAMLPITRQESEMELFPPSPQMRLGAGKRDPFGCYPIPAAPWIDQLIAHYVTIYQIAAVKGKNNAFSYILHDWVPLCMSSELTFLSLLLYTEIGVTKRHLYGATDKSPWTVRAIELSNKCTTILRKEIEATASPSAARKKRHPSGVSDSMLVAVTNMAMLELFLTRDPIGFRSHRYGLAQLVNLRGGIDQLHGALKIIASKIVSSEDLAQFPPVRRGEETIPRVQEIIGTTTAELNGAAAKINTQSSPQEQPVEPAPLTYNKVLDILKPT